MNNQDVLQVQGRMTLGYGIIPKIPMHDPRLTIESKAIYSYFCSYAGAGTTAFPSRDKILRDLKISEDRYYRHFNLLKKYGYIKVEQNIDNTGKFKNNIYTLVEMIEPYPQNKDTEPYPQNKGTEPYPQNKGTEPYPYYPGTDNKGTIINSIISNNNNIDNQKSKSMSESDQLPSVNTSVNKADKTVTMTTDVPIENISKMKKGLMKTPTNQSTGIQSPFPKEITYVNNDYNIYKNIIQENIDYQFFVLNCPSDIEMVDELVNCMLDVILTDGEKVKINGEQKSREMVKSQYLKINSQDIEHVMVKYREQRHKITHVHNYLKTMLYAVKQEVNAGIENAVRVDGLVW